MTPADQIHLCRAILIEVQAGLGQRGGPIRLAGYDPADVNETVRVLVEEGLLAALPPDTRYPDAWAANSVTYAGFEFLEAYRTDQQAADALRRSARRRANSDTVAEIVSTLAKAISFGYRP